MTSTRPAPALELADVIRRHGPVLQGVTGQQRRVLAALTACRTAALGGHVEACDHCRHQRVAYNSCRNRHCPKCRRSACARWMEARARDLLPVEYFHVVFTLPDAFNALALANPRVVYGVLFDAAAQTLLEVAANPKHLGAKIGVTAILHTWGQNLQLHPHVHCVVPGGGLAPDGTRWIVCRRGFFLPVRVLSRVFRGKFIGLLQAAFTAGKLRHAPDPESFEQLIAASVRTDWVVYAKRPFGGPEQVLKYLSRYTHRIALSNRRLVSMDERTVTFTWKDYADRCQRQAMTLAAPEFLRRFLMHVVPTGFVRIRHFGLLANRVRTANITRCRTLLGNPSREARMTAAHVTTAGDRITSERRPDGCDTQTCRDQCPACGLGHMLRIGRVDAQRRLGPLLAWNDTS